MKTLIQTLSAVVALSASAVAVASTYECHRYVDGKPTGGHVDVQASSASEATQLAMQKYRDMGTHADSVNCKIK